MLPSIVPYGRKSVFANTYDPAFKLVNLVIENLVVLVNGNFDVHKSIDCILSLDEVLVVQLVEVAEKSLFGDLGVECIHHLILRLILLLWICHLLLSTPSLGLWLLLLLLMAAPRVALSNLLLLLCNWRLCCDELEKLGGHVAQIAVLGVPLLDVLESQRVLEPDVVQRFHYFHAKLEIEVDLGRRKRVVGRQDVLDRVLHAHTVHRNCTLEHQVVVWSLARELCEVRSWIRHLQNRSQVTLNVLY